MKEKIEVILSIMAPLLTLLCTTIVFFQKFVKNKRLKYMLEHAEKITKMIIPYIVEAEELINYTGVEKKEYVMTKLNQYAIENKLKFDSNIISSKIEELLSMSKKVNYKDDIDNNVEKEMLNIIERMKE